jgi:hypothetical protein
MQDNAFTPFGPTYAVSGLPVQILTLNNQNATAYRIRNKLASVSILSWAAPLASGATPAITSAAPVVGGTPVQNTVGMVASSVEVFCLPPKAWFVSGSGDAFEVTPGEGI